MNNNPYIIEEQKLLEKYPNDEMLYGHYKSKYLSTRNPNDKILYKKYKYKMMAGNGTDTNYKHYCQPNFLETCIKNFENMRAMLKPYDAYRSILQGRWIRDRIGIKEFVTTILISEFKFNFKLLEWNIDDIYHTYEELSEKKSIEKSDDLKQKMNDYIDTLNYGNIYIILFSIPGHYNLHYVNKYSDDDKYVYIYEPHMPSVKITRKSYPIIKKIKTYYYDKGFNVKKLPANILKQKNLPLCYMYVIHFFMYLFVTMGMAIPKYVPDDDDYLLTKYLDVDDLYIMNFTRYILKLCHEYKLINYVDYYILTNNTHKIQILSSQSDDNLQIIGVNKNTPVYNLIEKISSSAMINIVYNFFPNIKLNMASFMQMCDIKSAINPERLREFILYIYNSNISNEIQICELIMILRLMDDLPDKIMTTNKKYYQEENIASIFRQCDHTHLYIDSLDSHGHTALMNAVDNEYDDIVKLLLENKADVNLRDTFGRQSTVLMDAVESDSENIVKLLLANKADVNLQNNLGWTALMYAVKSDSENMVKLLLENKADVDLWNNDGRTALMEAVAGNSENIVKLLLKNEADVNLQNNDNDGHTTLMQAVMNNNNNIVKLLLENKANIDLQDGHERSALMYAVIGNSENMVELLLKNNANVNLRHSMGHTVLMYASENMAKLLLKNKANVDLQDNLGRSALMKAVIFNFENMVKLLLKNKANVDLQDTSIWTALMYAATNNSENIVKLLLKHGANINLQNKKGKIALTLALGNNHDNIVKILTT